MHDGDRGRGVTTVEVTECPFYDADLRQEQFLKEVYQDVMNQQNPLGIPMIDWPQWIRQGVDHIAMVVHKEQERKKK